jgi:hypothetical protein
MHTPAKTQALRDGDLDIAFVRAPLDTGGLNVCELWSEPLLASLTRARRARRSDRRFVRRSLIAAAPARTPHLQPWHARPAAHALPAVRHRAAHRGALGKPPRGGSDDQRGQGMDPAHRYQCATARSRRRGPDARWGRRHHQRRPRLAHHLREPGGSCVRRPGDTRSRPRRAFAASGRRGAMLSAHPCQTDCGWSRCRADDR